MSDSGLVDWLRSTLNELERVAREASGREPGGPPESWRWEHCGDPNPRYPGHDLTDQPVDLDVWTEHIGANGPDFANRVSLRSAEQYPTPSVGELPHFVIHETDEQESRTARHIALNDPRSVLARVQAELRVIELHRPESFGQWDGTEHNLEPPYDCCVCMALDGAAEWPCDTLRWLAYGHRYDADGFDPAWAPEGVETQ